MFTRRDHGLTSWLVSRQEIPFLSHGVDGLRHLNVSLFGVPLTDIVLDLKIVTNPVCNTALNLTVHIRGISINVQKS